MAYNTELVEPKKLKSEDIIIVVMGLTASGKSQVIDTLTGQNTRADSGLESCTQEVSANRVLGHPKYGDKLVLVDTPGFDDSKKSDKEILKMIGQWMEMTYKRGITLAGIIYTHDITTSRMDGAPFRNLRMFANICGDEYAKSVIFLTTRWDEVVDTKEAEQQDAELQKSYWNDQICYGATSGRFYIDDPKSPWVIVDKMIQRHQLGQALLLQEEMVNDGIPFNKTSAVKALSSDFKRPTNPKSETIKLCGHIPAIDSSHQPISRQQPPMTYKTALVKVGNIDGDDIIIVLMGPTGSGKSRVIDTLTGQNTRAGSRLKSVTDEVSAHRVLGHRKYGNKLVLVDTPGFDNTYQSDKSILETISQWMTTTYKRRVTLTGVLYIQRITDVRMSGTPHRNLRMFGELCGDKSARDVMLLTTMWDKVRNTEEAEKREAGLKERYWNVMIHHGAAVGRFYKNDPESPWKVVDQVIQRHQLGQALLLQEEMVDLGKRLNETQAGKALFRSLQGLLNKQNKSIRLLEEQVEGGRVGADADMEALLAEAAGIKEEFESMKVPLGRKIVLLFKAFGKKEQAALVAFETPST